MTELSLPVRVLQVFGTLDRGGADTTIMTLYRRIDRTRLQFDFVVHGDREGVLEKEVRELGGRIFRVPRLTPASLGKYIAAWRELLRSHPEYQVLHGHYFTISGLYLGLGKLYGRRVIAHSHNTMPGIGGFLVAAFNVWLRWGADVRLACSTPAGEFFYGRWAARHDRFLVFRNPIEVSRFSYSPYTRELSRRELGLEASFVVGHVGRFNPQKNHELLLDIFVEVRRRAPESVLLLVGDGPERVRTEERAGTLGVADAVIFTGATADVATLYQAMDVFVLPSSFEGFGVVAIEAQAAGLPTIVSDAVPAEALPTDLGHVCRLQDSPAVWAECILGVRDLGPRRSYAFKIREAGFDGQESADRLVELYAHAGADTPEG